MKRPRDSQRSRVYKAESDCDSGLFRPMSFNGTIAYVNMITSSKHWKDKMGGPPVTVKDGRGRRRAAGNYYTCTIKMPRWSRTPLVILHELAHVAASSASVPAHGREFARAHLELIKKWRGYEAYVAMRESYKRHGVKYCASKGGRR